MKRKLPILFILAALIVPASAGTDFSGAEFSKAFSGNENGSPTPSLSEAEHFKTPSSEAEIAEKLDRWMSVLHELETQPVLDLSAVSEDVLKGLKEGTYNGVILGESHSSAPEIASGIALVKDILGTRGIGAFSRENFTFPDASFLEENKIPVLTFRNQFLPEADVKAGLKAAKKGILVTHTGHAHTARRLKDYILYTLEAGKNMGYAPGGKDMPTVEDAFLKAGKKPVIVSMMTEETVLRRVERLFFAHLAGKNGVYANELLSDLQALGRVWDAKVSRYPSSPGKIFFVRFPGQNNFFVGITPGERKLSAMDAVAKVLPLPELAAWLGGEKIKFVESLFMSGPDGVSYKVVIHKFNGGTFENAVQP